LALCNSHLGTEDHSSCAPLPVLVSEFFAIKRILDGAQFLAPSSYSYPEYPEGTSCPLIHYLTPPVPCCSSLLPISKSPQRCVDIPAFKRSIALLSVLRNNSFSVPFLFGRGSIGWLHCSREPDPLIFVFFLPFNTYEVSLQTSVSMFSFAHVFFPPPRQSKGRLRGQSPYLFSSVAASAPIVSTTSTSVRLIPPSYPVSPVYQLRKVQPSVCFFSVFCASLGTLFPVRRRLNLVAKGMERSLH